jgi:TorA maturation chaperone TorD
VSARTATFEALADALDGLAGAFLAPATDLAVLAQILQAGGQGCAAELASLGRHLECQAAGSADELAVEHTRLFRHGRRVTAYLHESYYRTGQLGDAECLGDLAELCGAAGVRPRELPAPLLDHLALELDLLALLLRGLGSARPGSLAHRQINALTERLLGDHLDSFVPGFLERLAAAAPGPAFATVAEALTVVLSSTRAALADASRSTRRAQSVIFRSTSRPARPIKHAGRTDTESAADAAEGGGRNA